MSSPIPSPEATVSTIRDFEDFRLGQQFAGGDRLVTSEDLSAFATLGGDRHPLHTSSAYAEAHGFHAPLAHGPFGIAVFFGWFHELRLAADAIVALLDTNWRYMAPIHAGDRLRFEMTITRLRRTTAGNRGIVGRHARILKQNGTVAQEGTTSLLVRARGSQHIAGQELFTRAWAEAVGTRLDRDEAFRAATATWDGTIGMGDGRDEAQFRIHRGKVLEAGTRSINGPTFTIIADELTWAKLVTCDANDFMRRAMQGRFSVRGSAYEYLRLTKTIKLLVDCARAELREGPRL